MRSFRFSFRGKIRMYPRSGSRSRGKSAKTIVLENHPFVNPRTTIILQKRFASDVASTWRLMTHQMSDEEYLRFLCVPLLCVLIPALNLSKNSCVFPRLDKALGKRTIPKITRNGPKNPQWRLTATNRRLIVTNRRLIATNRPKSATNRD